MSPAFYHGVKMHPSENRRRPHTCTLIKASFLYSPMQSNRPETTVIQDGIITLRDVPFRRGDSVEVIILPFPCRSEPLLAIRCAASQSNSLRPRNPWPTPIGRPGGDCPRYPHLGLLGSRRCGAFRCDARTARFVGADWAGCERHLVPGSLQLVERGSSDLARPGLRLTSAAALVSWCTID